MAILLFPVIHETKRHRIVFIVLRVIAAPLVVILFVVLTRNFYKTDPSAACSWCRYLSCWPTASNNVSRARVESGDERRTDSRSSRPQHCKGTGISTSTASATFGSLLTVIASTFLLPLL